MESSTLPDESVIKATTDIVAVASHVDNDHKTIDVVENGVKVKRCSIYPNLACEDHVRTSEVGMIYIKGRFAAPVSIWCDAAGKELFRKHGFRQPEVFQEDLKEALAKVPGTRIPKADYDLQARPFEDGLEALKNGKYKPAAEGLMAAAKGKIEALKKEAEKALNDINRIAADYLNRGRSALEAGKRPRARELLEYAAAEFPALDAGREASELLKKIGVEDKDRK
jgi:tetratricopeptide (TPR) repeat protein